VSEIDKAALARMMDLSCVLAESALEEIDAAVALARRHGIFAIFVLPAHIPYLIEKIGDADILPAATVGFPSGAATTAGKAAETREQLAMGCREFDMVNNIAWLKAGEFDLYRDDVRAVIDAAEGRPVKVILECHHLTDDEIVRGADICADAGVAFVKTATGWPPTGATLENVALIKKTVGNRCGVKAAGGIRDLETLMAMHRLGATRFGIGVRSAAGMLED